MYDPGGAPIEGHGVSPDDQIADDRARSRAGMIAPWKPRSHGHADDSRHRAQERSLQFRAQLRYIIATREERHRHHVTE